MLLITPSFASETPGRKVLNSPSFDSKLLSSSQFNLTELSPLELGYGPSSLTSINYEIPIYTVNDQLWIGSNYNFTIQAQLLGAQGQTLASQSIGSGTILRLYGFPSSFSSSNLTLEVSTTSSCVRNCFSSSVPIQFVNASSTYISSIVSRYSINAAALSSSYSIQPSNANLMPNIEECMTNASSANEAVVGIPSSFGSGALGIVGDPNTTSFELLFGNASPSKTFLFSFELLANYTYALSQSNGTGYRTSEVEVASFPSIVMSPTNSSIGIQSLPLSQLAPFRSGRYLLAATFQNAGGVSIVDTPLLIESGNASSWFWLGACQELSTGSGYSVSSRSNLSSSSGDWPRYLFLMYQVYPGIDSFANFSLNLPINRVEFYVSGFLGPFPSDIQLSQVSSESKNIQDLDIESGGVVYAISTGYPASIAISLLFSGKPFATQSVNLASAYSDQSDGIGLGELSVAANQTGRGISGATVIIYSNSLEVSLTTSTGSSGNAVVLVPPGDYTITVQSGGHAKKSSEMALSSGEIDTFTVVFPAQTNYTMELIWIVSFVAVAGAIGNLWFWILRRRVRSFPH